MTETEQKTRLSHLETSLQTTLEILKGVDEKGFRHKANPQTWSIAEVIEHVIKVEKAVVGNLQQLGTANKTAPPLDKPLSNDTVMELSASRQLKFKAPDIFLPTGIFTNKAEAITAYKQCRQHSIAFINTNAFSLDNIIVPHPRIGPLNGKQWLLFIAGHNLKHVAQIKDLVTMKK